MRDLFATGSPQTETAHGAKRAACSPFTASPCAAPLHAYSARRPSVRRYWHRRPARPRSSSRSTATSAAASPSPCAPLSAPLPAGSSPPGSISRLKMWYSRPKSSRPCNPRQRPEAKFSGALRSCSSFAQTRPSHRPTSTMATTRSTSARPHGRALALAPPRGSAPPTE
jgi:hypothetical protein